MCALRSGLQKRIQFKLLSLHENSFLFWGLSRRSFFPADLLKNLLMKVVRMVQMKDAYVPLLLAATLWMMPYTGEVRVAPVTAFAEPLLRTWAAEQQDVEMLTGAVSGAQGEKTFSTQQEHLNTNFFKDFF